MTVKLQNVIDEVTRDCPTVTTLMARLQEQGVKVHPIFSTRGLFREAIAFEMDGVSVAGNKLGRAYSFPGLQKHRGVSYDPNRDLPAILAVAGKPVEPEEATSDNSSSHLATESKTKASVIDNIKQTKRRSPPLNEVQQGSILLDEPHATLIKVGTYTLKREGNTRCVIANDGRGEVLRLTDGWVEKALLEDLDVAFWKQIEGSRKQQQRTQPPSQQQSQMEL